MRRNDSLKAIKAMTPKKRLNLARDKLSQLDDGLVQRVLTHLEVHENTQWLVYRTDVTSQVVRSFAAHAFSTLQNTCLFFEVIQLCSFWDPVDLDSRSVPTIAALADGPDISALVYDEFFTHYDDRDAKFREGYAQNSCEVLKEALEKAKDIENSDMLERMRNFRHKLAHQIEISTLEKDRLEKKRSVAPPLTGFERKLLDETVNTVDLLYRSISGVDFAWDDAKRMKRRNAEALWKGVSINVLR